MDIKSFLSAADVLMDVSAPDKARLLQKLADRAKLVLSSDLMRRWTLAEIAGALRVSPVYLTQVFQ